ncbi:MAG: dephospho-CoA kinase [Phycisphaeraceae bacterium]|nr:dephospho-CoA kinase [Phycisphaeraceae bacterium]
MNGLPVIGLVGGIGSGKSLVASILRQEGCLVCDSDAMTRDLMRDPRVHRQLVEWWGSGVLDRDGEIDRGQVASVVFARPEERLRLEGLIHPLVEARREAIFANPPSGTRALVIDAPLLLEAGLKEKCDAIFFVDAPRTTRLARVAETRGWSAEEVSRRETAQWPLDRKRQAADTVLSNDGDPASLRIQVVRALEQVLAGIGRVG